MNKRLKTYVSIVITTLVVILCLNIWPWKNIKSPATNAHGNVTATEESAMLGSETTVTQLFVTFGEHLQEITLECNVYHLNPSESIKATIMDENGATFFEKEISVKKIKDGKLIIKPQKDCEWGRVYRLRLRLVGDESVIAVKTAGINEMALQEYLELAVFSIEQDYSYSFVADFTYLAESTPVRMVFNMGLVIGGGILVYFCITMIYGRFFADSEKRRRYVSLIARSIVSIALLGLYGFGFFEAAIANVFGGQIYDQVIHGLGMTILLLTLLYAIWNKVLWKQRKESNEQEELDDSFFEKGQVIEKKTEVFHPYKCWINYLQVITIGILLHCCVMYQNAAKMYDQDVRLEWAGILLGVVLLLQQVEKTIEKILTWNYERVAIRQGKPLVDDKNHKKTYLYLLVQVFLLVALLCVLVYDSLGYCATHGETAEDLYLAKLSCARIGIWATVILHTLYYFKKRILKSFHIPMVVIWAFFAIWLWTHHYDHKILRYIPIYFSIFMLQDFEREDYKRLLYHMMDGMIVAFLINMTLSLLYRPYHRWIFYRYPMYFHTVACTGEFLVGAYAVSLAKFFLKVKNGTIINGLKELVLTGIVFTYEMLSMARTTMTATVGLLVVGLIIFGIIYKKKLKQIGITLLSFLIIVVVTFPLVFSATRITPALVDAPYRFPIYLEEDFAYGVEKGDPVDSRDYMVFMRFLYCYMARYHFPTFIENWVEEQYREIAYNQEYEDGQLLLANSSISPLNFFFLGDITEGSPDDEANNDVSNGRFDIWKAYLSNLNLTGHEKMAVVDENGHEYVHAHNSFIQMAYSTGLIGGIAFLLLYAGSLLVALVKEYQARLEEYKDQEHYLITLMIIVGYGIASLTEWLSSMMIPLAMLYWLSIVILCRNPEKIDERKELRTVQKNI